MTTSMQISGTHPFVFRWGTNLSSHMMEKMCTKFSTMVEKIPRDLTGKNLIAAIERACQVPQT